MNLQSYSKWSSKGLSSTVRVSISLVW